MDEFPTNEYSIAIIGDYWPQSGEQMSLQAAAHRTKRSEYHTARSVNLERILTQLGSVGSSGKSMRTLEESLQRRVYKHREVAENDKHRAYYYNQAANEEIDLKRKLKNIDHEAHKKIHEIEHSDGSAEERAEAITSTVTKYREDARYALASSIATMRHLIVDGIEKTNINMTLNDAINQAGGYDKQEIPSAETNYTPQTETMPTPGKTTTANSATASAGSNSSTPGDVMTVNQASNASTAASPTSVGAASSNPASSTAGSNSSTPNGVPAVQVSAPSSGVPGSVGGGAGVGGSGFPAAVSNPAASAGNVGNMMQGSSAGGAVQGFSSGVESGVPAAAGGQTATQAVVNTATGGSSAPVVNTVPPPGPVVSEPVVVQSHGDHGVEHAPVHEGGQGGGSVGVGPVMGTTPPAAQVGSAGVASSAPGGSLPAYGSDIRTSPPVTEGAQMSSVSSARSLPVAGSAAPTTTPSSGLGQTAAVVRHTATSAPQNVPGVRGGSVGAAAATASAGEASGAAGAVAAIDEAQQRCDDLVNALAVQEPRLGWAVGTCTDGSVVVATDLAGGWIPPHVRPPAVAQLVQPGAAMWDHDRVLDMVDAGARSSLYAPGQPTRLVPGVELGDGPREVAPLYRREDELRYQLKKAAGWRNGLPQKLEYLAKCFAMNARPMERDFEFLRELEKYNREKSFAAYPETIDLHQVADWMIGASIDAFYNNKHMVGCYHFAWFHAVTRHIGPTFRIFNGTK